MLTLALAAGITVAQTLTPADYRALATLAERAADRARSAGTRRMYHALAERVRATATTTSKEN